MPLDVSQLTREQRQQLLFDTRAQLFGLLLHFAGAVAYFSGPWPVKIQRLARLPISALPFVWSSLFSKSYLKYREPFFAVFRLAFFLFPVLRQPTGIQNALNAPAALGPSGAITDVLRMAFGSRLLTNIYFSIALHQSITLYTLGQVYGAIMTRRNDSLCKSTLLQSSLTRQRLRTFNKLTIGLLVPQGVLAMESIQDDNDDSDCSFFLTLLHVLFAVCVPVTAAATLGRNSRFAGKNLLITWLISIQLAWALSVTLTCFTAF